jgi:hypothetical protein
MPSHGPKWQHQVSNRTDFIVKPWPKSLKQFAFLFSSTNGAAGDKTNDIAGLDGQTAPRGPFDPQRLFAAMSNLKLFLKDVTNGSRASFARRYPLGLAALRSYCPSRGPRITTPAVPVAAAFQN